MGRANGIDGRSLNACGAGHSGGEECATEPRDLLFGTARQAELCAQVAAAYEEAVQGFEVAGVAVAIDVLVADALVTIDQLTGADSWEDVLDALFARFCIGK